MEDSLN